jgi:starch-binding outer membrane protein, SusD/RagB family
MVKRKYISVLFLSFLLLIGSSCEDILDKAPNGVLSTASFYKTGKDAEAAVNSAYTILLDFWVSNIAFEKDIISDDAVKGQGVDLGALTNFDNLNFIPGDGVVAAYWGIFYKGIHRCNLVLDYVPDIEMDKADQDRILGEAYFLRAYYNYNLAIRFGALPLVKSTLDADKKPARSTIEDTWNFMKEDLEKAASLLPRKSEYSAAHIGRADKGAALSLLGIVNLHRQSWQEAFNAFKQVIDSGDYGLQPNFGDLFKPEFDNGTEVVFETQAKGGADFAYSNGFNFWVRPRNGSTIFGLGFCLPTQDLVDEFEPGDPRLKYTVIRNGDIISDEVKDFPFNSAWAPETGMNCGKYVVDVPVGNLAERHEQNQKNIRYAEVLLGYAEAAFRTGNTAEAVAKINMVRQRARGGKPDILPNVKASDDIFAAIVHERRVELALEGKRYFDLVRWGLAESELGPLGYQSARKGLYPIPQTELDVNPNLVQNPGY